jgi:hypothetical protein
MTDFEAACKEACEHMRKLKGCDLRCMDGRGRCANFLAHVSGKTGMTWDEVLEKWRADNGE